MDLFDSFNEIECRGSDFKMNGMPITGTYRGQLFQGPHVVKINQTQDDIVGEITNSTSHWIIGSKVAFDNPKRVLFYGNENMEGIFGIKQEAE